MLLLQSTSFCCRIPTLSCPPGHSWRPRTPTSRPKHALEERRSRILKAEGNQGCPYSFLCLAAAKLAPSFKCEKGILPSQLRLSLITPSKNIFDSLFKWSSAHLPLHFSFFLGMGWLYTFLPSPGSTWVIVNHWQCPVLEVCMLLRQNWPSPLLWPEHQFIPSVCWFPAYWVLLRCFSCTEA